MSKLNSLIDNLLFALTLWLLMLLSKIAILLPKSRKIDNKSILYLENFPFENAGYQNRALEWKNILSKNGYKVKILTIFKDKKKYESYFPKKTTRLMFISMIIRFFQILNHRNFATIIVRRELLLFNDYGNLFMEKLLLNLNDKVILDFDDDIQASKNNTKTKKNLYNFLLFKKENKFYDSLNLYERFFVGSEYLKECVLNNQKTKRKLKIQIIPTCVKVINSKKKKFSKNNKTIVFGWIGGNYNLKNLDKIIDPLNNFSSLHKIKLVVISGLEYKNKKAKFSIENKRWTLANQYDDLLKIDIGLMPLEDDLVSLGKCGFKILQYMSLGIASISDAIGENNNIVVNNVTGYLVKENKWTEAIQNIEIEKLSKMGENAFLRAEKFYTFQSNINNYIKLL